MIATLIFLALWLVFWFTRPQSRKALLKSSAYALPLGLGVYPLLTGPSSAWAPFSFLSGGVALSVALGLRDQQAGQVSFASRRKSLAPVAALSFAMLAFGALFAQQAISGDIIGRFGATAFGVPLEAILLSLALGALVSRLAEKSI